MPVSVVTAVAEAEGGDPELTATKLLFLQEQVRKPLVWHFSSKLDGEGITCVRPYLKVGHGTGERNTHVDPTSKLDMEQVREPLMWTLPQSWTWNR